MTCVWGCHSTWNHLSMFAEAAGREGFHGRVLETSKACSMILIWNVNGNLFTKRPQGFVVIGFCWILALVWFRPPSQSNVVRPPLQSPIYFDANTQKFNWVLNLVIASVFHLLVQSRWWFFCRTLEVVLWRATQSSFILYGPQGRWCLVLRGTERGCRPKRRSLMRWGWVEFGPLHSILVVIAWTSMCGGSDENAQGRWWGRFGGRIEKKFASWFPN